MRLSTIKLVGFKSFVDPTKIPFPAQMTCVVGPNGCGKSNVIDAVRWVLGESSAKNLRGDAMTDVIFNGSTSRKPISQASVELIFDNTQGLLPNTLVARNQVSIKRLVTRDAQSFYFLNGSKCRKKDITDIFLGTGLGPRSYAIIEQGMISRLIESKPQELRVFIEEAAGVSKYKERRRETELRLKSTRENLERLLDVRVELQAQLDKLESQSAQAQAYTKYKANERVLKSELAVLKWQQIQDKLNINSQKIAELEKDIALYQETHAGQLDVLASIKLNYEEVTHRLTEQQQNMHGVQTQLTKFEQQKIHIHQQQQSLASQILKIEQQKRHYLELQDKLTLKTALSFKEVTEAEQELVHSEQAVCNSENALAEQKKQIDDHFNEFQIQQKAFHQIEKSHENMQYQITHLSQSLKQVSKQKLVYEQELMQLDQQNVANELVKLKQYQIELKQSLSQAQLTHQEKQQVLHLAQTDHDQQRLLLHELEKINLEKSAELNALSGLLVHTHPDDVSGIELLSQLKVVPGYELIIEQALSLFKNAYVIDNSNIVKDMNEGRFVWPMHDGEPKQKFAVASQILSGVYPELLNRIALIEKLDKEEILSDAYWFAGIDKKGVLHGRNWQLNSELNESASILLTVKQVERLTAELEVVQQDIKQQKIKRETSQDKLNFELSELEKVKLSIHELAQQDVTTQTRLELLSKQFEHWQQQQIAQTEKIKQLNAESQLHQKSLDEQTDRFSHMQLELDTYKSKLTIAEQDYKASKHSAAKNHQNHDQLKNEHHNMTMQLQKLKNEIVIDENQLKNAAQHLNDATMELQLLAEQKVSLAIPLEELELQIQAAITDLSMHEATKADLTQKLEADKLHMTEKEKDLKTDNNHFEQLQSTLRQGQIDQQGQMIRAEACLEPLIELKTTREDVQQNMPKEAALGRWQLKLNQTNKDILALGAINLAAIDEFKQAEQRKTYLDEQYQDLTEALATLTEAINKIDKETKTKFKVTFDAINSSLNELFPKVFGGGHAYLALTSDDLLDTGVSIMARPPGKKNSTIHLLSGGEKALTALSLVFSIFRLNPAPFCMLDEVDAPLDDANVVRFCRLVEEMSQSVQFIYISHNKIAMEMAGQLTGVTMSEPGVSRFVSVDIDQAVEMAS